MPARPAGQTAISGGATEHHTDAATRTFEGPCIVHSGRASSAIAFEAPPCFQRFLPVSRAPQQVRVPHVGKGQLFSLAYFAQRPQAEALLRVEMLADVWPATVVEARDQTVHRALQSLAISLVLVQRQGRRQTLPAGRSHEAIAVQHLGHPPHVCQTHALREAALVDLGVVQSRLEAFGLRGCRAQSQELALCVLRQHRELGGHLHDHLVNSRGQLQQQQWSFLQDRGPGGQGAVRHGNLAAARRLHNVEGAAVAGAFASLSGRRWAAQWPPPQVLSPLPTWGRGRRRHGCRCDCRCRCCERRRGRCDRRDAGPPQACHGGRS
mmetsp:Transcript_26701/g.88696  ORF Transcript_26701/g.88696 Transcript_26701/m.88696 type:complete len:323 (-) Transcript_26701:192-1160(-)